MKKKTHIIVLTGKNSILALSKKAKALKVYKPQKGDCDNCPFYDQCMGKSKNIRSLEVHLHERARKEQSKNIGTVEYYRAMNLRQIWCEGNFSHQKENHNLKRTRKWGIERVTEQCLLSACALNLKRMVKLLKGEFSRLIYTVFYSSEHFYVVLCK